MKTLLRFLPLVACSVALAPVHAQAAATATASRPAVRLSVDLLSDTGGADLGPYMKTLVAGLRAHWVPLMNETGKAQPAKPEETVIRLSIAPDGHVLSMKLEDSAEDADLNKVAWAATSGTQYAPPPAGLKDPNLNLRVHFVVR